MRRFTECWFDAAGKLLMLAIALSLAACGGSSSSGPNPAPGAPFGVAAGGIFIFNSGPGVASPEIQEYAADVKTGATTQVGSVTTGAELAHLEFTIDGNFAYGLAAAGNLWGYAFSDKTQTLTSLGILASGLPATANLFGIYDSNMLWVTDVAGAPGARSTTVYQYPIEDDGDLGTATTVTLTGADPIAFIPSGSSLPDLLPVVVWTYRGTEDPTLFSLNVYPVDDAGMIGGTPLQTINSTPILNQALAPASFAYGIGGSSGQTLSTFTIADNGTLAAASSVALPASGSWFVGGINGDVVPGLAATIDLVSEQTVGQASFLIYPVTDSGSVGTLLQTISLSCQAGLCLPQFAFSRKVDQKRGPVPPLVTPEPNLWLLPYSATISAPAIYQYPLKTDGTINPVPTANVATGNSVLGIDPGQAPFSYGTDLTDGNIFAYGVSTPGILTALGSFAGPTIPAGFSHAIQVFPAEEFTDAPVALYVEVENSNPAPPPLFNGGTVDIYALGSNGLPAAGALPIRISVPFAEPETYLLLNNGLVLADRF